MTSQMMLAKLKYMDAEIQAMIKLVELDIELEQEQEQKPAAKPRKKAAKKLTELETLQKEFNTICKLLPANEQKKVVRLVREVNLGATKVEDLGLDELKEIMPDIRALGEDYK